MFRDRCGALYYSVIDGQQDGMYGGTYIYSLREPFTILLRNTCSFTVFFAAIRTFTRKQCLERLKTWNVLVVIKLVFLCNENAKYVCFVGHTSSLTPMLFTEHCVRNNSTQMSVLLTMLRSQIVEWSSTIYVSVPDVFEMRNTICISSLGTEW